MEIKNYENYVIVEIGAFLGRSTIFLSQGLKEREEGILISIDPHKGIPYYHPNPTYDDFLVNLIKAEVINKVDIKKGTSKKWSSEIKEGISLLFIDGDHRYEMVKKDFLLYEKKIIEGGYIAFHDSVLDGPFNVIVEAVNSGQWEFLQIIGNLALLRKNTLKKSNKIDLLTILNLILLYINRQFHLDFVENDEKSMRIDAQELLTKLTI
ncbi:MAG: class I SAM-dependent methyltransferase [Candidatus Helarchaeota archaeon]